jgi:hypothetical protein
MIKSGGNNPAVSRLWAQQKIRELELDSEKNEEEILKLGKEYSVVTEFTSLLVLEELSDYVNYRITPPQELLSEYNRAIANLKNQEERQEKSALDDAIALAGEIKEWWKKDFDQSKPPGKFEKLKTAGSEDTARIESEIASQEERLAISRSDVTPPRAASAILAASPMAEMARTAAPAQVPAEVNADALSSPAATAGISVKAWDPQTPYMKILKKSQDGELYKDYLKLKDGYDDQPSFYFDVTDEFMLRGLKDKAVVVLSNIAEMKLDNVELLLTTANKLIRADCALS